VLVRSSQDVVKASLLVRAAELKREKPLEDEGAKRAREEQEILQNITVRALAALGAAHTHAFGARAHVAPA
jgi:hypothetical protein